MWWWILKGEQGWRKISEAHIGACYVCDCNFEFKAKGEVGSELRGPNNTGFKPSLHEWCVKVWQC
jgi:hypothetical protein